MIPGSIAAAPWSYLTPVFLLICSNLFMTFSERRWSSAVGRER
jgi:uncharacterized protein (DUF486 family)